MATRTLVGTRAHEISVHAESTCATTAASMATGRILDPNGALPQGDNQARAATTNASTPVSSVGWMTGAKRGL